MSQRTFRVLQMIDSLQAGGAERVAVNLANEVAERGHVSHLCVTRMSGSLESDVQPDVSVLRLDRTATFDFGAVARLRSYVGAHKIEVVHAHSTSVFLGALAAGGARLLWHDHYGAHGLNEGSPLPFRIIRRRIHGAVAVDPKVRLWGIKRVGLDAHRVWELPNFVRERPPQPLQRELPGEPGGRIVCLANLRPQKDHLNLVEAMARVVAAVPQAHLLCVGQSGDQRYSQSIIAAIRDKGLTSHVSLLGTRVDVGSILAQCDVGVLSSLSEGFPLALLEYGSAGLPVISTDVGRCAEILDEGSSGLLVPPHDPVPLASGLVSLLSDQQLRARLGTALHEKVARSYSANSVMERLLEIYELISS